MAHYNLEHSYNKFSGKKFKDSLSSFLPNLPGQIDTPGSVDNSSLRSIIEKPPIGGKELVFLNNVQLAGFRLHPGPVNIYFTCSFVMGRRHFYFSFIQLPEQYRIASVAQQKKKQKHKKHKKSNEMPAQEASGAGGTPAGIGEGAGSGGESYDKKHKKQKRHEEDKDRKKKKKEKKKKKQKHSPEHPGISSLSNPSNTNPSNMMPLL